MNHTRTIYATAMLTSSTGEDYTSILNGNWNVTAQLVVNSSSGGGGSSSRHSGDEWLYFIFNPVSIGMAGEYTFSLIVSAMNLVNRTSVVVGGKSTRQVTVVNRAVAPTRPSKTRQFVYIERGTSLTRYLGSSERHVLRRLEAEGLYSPGGMGQ